MTVLVWVGTHIGIVCYEKKSKIITHSAAENKKIVKNILKTSSKIHKPAKLIIIIDDIDRLDSNEIQEVFMLVKKNADFPNTLYLLAFDEEVVKKALIDKGTPEHNYLDKIIQASLHVPAINPVQFAQYLSKNLHGVLAELPESAQKYRGGNDQYLKHVYNSGFDKLFTNIRDVKRFRNTLMPHIRQVYQGDGD